MPPRVGFKKSRGGCFRCKSRKVKCDEQRPVCGWCAEHSQHCEYPRAYRRSHDSIITPPQTEPSPATESLQDRSLTSHPLLDEGSSQHRLLELSLLHYYVTTVARSFPFVDREYGFMLHAEAIPQQALRCSSLLDALYAFALLHLHVETSAVGNVPSNADFLEDLGLCLRNTERVAKDRPSSPVVSIAPFTLHQHYLDKAVMEQKKAISDINNRNADAVCLASILIGMITLVHSAEEMSTNPTARYTIPLQWFYLFRSFSACLAIARPLLGAESATYRMIHGYARPLAEYLLSATTSNFRHLVDWQPAVSIEAMNNETYEAYDTAFRVIENIHNYIINDEPWEALGRHILAFPGLVPDLFVTFLEETRPRALVMLAHLLAMSKKLDQRWWVFKGVADTHIREISLMVPDEWQWAMEWPLQVVSQEKQIDMDINV